jgi:hypothetical protein
VTDIIFYAPLLDVKYNVAAGNFNVIPYENPVMQCAKL